MKRINDFAFPETTADMDMWQPTIRVKALASKVLCVARTRCEGAWSAYVDAVPGQRHSVEAQGVLDEGVKLPVHLARVLFPEFDDVPYSG